MKHDYNKELFDALCGQLAMDYIDKENVNIAEKINSLPEADLSQNFRRKMNILIFKMKMQSRLKKLSGYAAVLILLVGAVGITNTKIINAVKSNFTNSMVWITDKFISTARFNSNVEYDTTQFPLNWQYIYIPTKLPSGYHVDNIKSIGQDYFAINYSKGDESLKFEVWNADSVVNSFDTSSAQITRVKLNLGTDGLIVTTKDSIYLNWGNEGYDFTLTGSNITAEDLQEIADSVEKIAEQ